MPTVDGVKYPYTPAGIRAAAAAKKKTSSSSPPPKRKSRRTNSKPRRKGQTSEITGESYNCFDAGFPVGLFKGVKYKYHVENILKGKDCLIPTSGRMLKWSSGDNGQGVCYFTMKTPGWAMWENCSGWTWLGRRIKNYGKH